MTGNKNAANTQFAAAVNNGESARQMPGVQNRMNAAGTQLMTEDSIHKTEMKNNSARNTVKLEQFQAMMTNIVRNALEENNQALGREVGNQVEDKVIKEMNYLMRVQEEAEEERYRKLDAAIRTYRKGKRVKEDKPQKVRRFSRKENKLNPNLSI